MIILPGITFLVSLFIGYYYFSQNLETQTVERMERIVSDHRHMIDSFLKERQADLEFVIDAYSFDHVSRHEKPVCRFFKAQAKFGCLRRPGGV